MEFLRLASKFEGVGTGDYIDVAMMELAVRGRARVLAVEPCPPIEDGPGRIVTGAFRSHSVDMRRLKLRDLPEPIEVTGNHPIYSEDRRDFVMVSKIRDGERMLTRDGVAIVESVTAMPGQFEVFNLEIDEAHQYYVSEQTVLVHNSNGGWDAAEDAATIHGSGNGPGIFEMGARSKSTAVIRQQLSDGKVREFAYLPDNDIFAMNKQLDYRMTGPEWPGSDGSPHSTILSTLPGDETAVGGTIFQRDGQVLTDEMSGHYGKNWNDAIRAKFTQFMKANGFDVQHSAYGK